MPYDQLAHTSIYTPLSSLDLPNRQQLKEFEPLAHISASFIRALFQQESTQDPFFPLNTYLPLPFFISYALSQSPLDPSVTFASLNLLYRYKSRVVSRHIKLRDPSRLYMAAYLVAAKATSDKPYPMRTWASIAQNNYDTVELVDMEKAFCATLNWDLRINDEVVESLRIVINTLLSTTAGDERSDSPSALIPTTPEMHSSPTSSDTSASPATEDEWVRLSRELDQPRASLGSAAVVQSENEGKIISGSEPLPPSVPKPSRKKRFSDLFQGKLGVSLLRRD